MNFWVSTFFNIIARMKNLLFTYTPVGDCTADLICVFENSFNDIHV